MDNWERYIWLPALAVAAVAASIAFALTGFLVLAACAGIAAGAAIGATATMLVFQTQYAARARKLTAESGNKKLIKLLHSEIAEAASQVVAAAWQGRTAPRRIDATLPLILIAQVQRSGGSLLSQLFDGHPEVLAFPHELKWGGSVKFCWPKVQPADGPLETARRLVAANLRQNKRFNLIGYHKPALQSDARDRDQHLPFQWSEWHYVAAFLDRWYKQPPESTRDCLNIFLSSYFSAFFDWHVGSAPKVITAFTPRANFVNSYPENMNFFRDYPEGLMISICRHPADWYASAQVHQERYKDADGALVQWRQSTNPQFN